MDKIKIEEYLEKFPIEIREPIMALNTDQKWALFIALTLDKEMYFNEIRRVFNGNANTVDTNLKALVASGLIAKKVKKIADIKNQEKTYYHATEFGKQFLYTLSEIGLPKIPEMPAYHALKEDDHYKYLPIIQKNLTYRGVIAKPFDINMRKYVEKTNYIETTIMKRDPHTRIQKAEV